jgi:multidrug efflux pump subunit AcrB
MMTAVSFIFGIVPLAISTGAGAGARQAVGVTIFGGMLAATTIGLFIIPTLFAVIERLAEWSSARPEAETEPPKG